MSRTNDRVVAICSAVGVVFTAVITIMEMRESKKILKRSEGFIPKPHVEVQTDRPEGTTGIDTEQFVYDVKFVSMIKEGL